MGSGGFPADGALQAELTALRARAYGVDADIGADPVAVARLAELEELHAASASPTAQEAGAARDDRGVTRTTAVDVGQPDGARPGWWRRTRAGVFLAGAAVATAAAVAIGGWILWTAPRPDMTLHPTGASPSEQMLRLTDDYARRQLVMKSTLTAYEQVLGLEVWSAQSVLGNNCLMVVDPVTDDLLDVGCVPPPAEPLVEINDVPVAWMQEWTERFPSGTAVRFVQTEDAVEVWVYEAPASGELDG